MTYNKILMPLIISSLLLLGGFSPSCAQANTSDLHISKSKILKEAHNLKPEVLSLALKAYTNAEKSGVGVNKHLLTVIDYSMPSAKKRMWVIDLNNSHVLMNLLVAHGKNTGWKDAKKFSNTPQSRETSLGLFETEQTYSGHNGYSLRLKGLDQGFNNNAESRAIVVHGAPYVSDAFAKQYNRVGNSWGCPAVDKKYSSQLINTIKGGSLLFAYYPDPTFLSHSIYLQA